MIAKVENMLKELEAAHASIGQEETLYSRAATLIEQLDAAVSVTMETRYVLQETIQKLEAKLANQVTESTHAEEEKAKRRNDHAQPVPAQG